jgi:hypothetical protein
MVERRLFADSFRETLQISFHDLLGFPRILPRTHVAFLHTHVPNLNAA